MIRAVLDTTVLVSAVLFGGVPQELLVQAEHGAFTLILSEQLLAELDRTLRKSKFRRLALDESKLREIQSRLRRLSPETVLEVLTAVAVFDPDPKDTHILAAAYTAQADYLVTGDHALLQLRTYQDTRIVTPREFLERLEPEA